MNLTSEQIAAQLRCPHGETGRAFGHAMNLRNLAQTADCLRHLRPQANEKLLEIGYGNGGLLGFILAHAANLHYSGVEISVDMHREACTFNQAFIEKGLADYNLYDGLHLPYPDAAFNAIFSVNTLYFWQDPAVLLSECVRVLQKGGRLALGFSEKAFLQELPFAQYGFTLYNAADVLKLAQPLMLRALGEYRHQDWAVSKDGQLVLRETVHLLFEKSDVTD